MVVVMVTNLIKRHPNCKVLIHRKVGSESKGEDPFIDSEKDPVKTRALDSSLWELEVSVHMCACMDARIPTVCVCVDVLHSGSLPSLPLRLLSSTMCPESLMWLRGCSPPVSLLSQRRT